MNLPKTTRDGSPTLYSDRFNEHYHSIHGAIQESQHVFLDMGLLAREDGTPLRVFEMGFGTGLNALMTAMQATVPVHYLTIEAYPLTDEEVQYLDYGQRQGDEALFRRIHAAEWNQATSLRPEFVLEKHHLAWEEFPGTSEIDLVYWDAFAPGSQPELWTPHVFGQIRSWMNPGGIMTTYSAKGDVRRAMIATGFEVEKLPGPPGKREMLRGIVPTI